MELFADIAIGAGALLAAAYCMLLSRRLRAFTRLDGDVGRAIAVLSTQVDQLTRALASAESGAASRESALGAQIAAAEQAARRLELLMAAERPQKPKPAPDIPSATATQAVWSQADHGFEPLERATSTDNRLRTTRSRGGGRI